VERLNLETVGVQYDKKGVQVDDYLQTTNPRIFAAGDVCSRYQFTHAADFMARTAIRNALFPGRTSVKSLVIPWCTYTLPELAHVGLTEKEASDKHVAIDSFVQEFREVDRAVLEGEENGFVKIHIKRGTDRIVGATIVARNAGDLISEITLAMTQGIGLKQIANTIHPYPTQAEAIRKLGDQFNRRRLTPFVRKVFNAWLKWTR
jgi:pyruvate/2-oxoglutarate dehydrogenase complex dihydrolipoamide dehydrogenase (E3) component